MWLRRGFFGWLFPAAVVLPLWLLLGWAVTGAGGWAFLWLMLAVPGVFIWQLILTLLVRARGTVRAHRAVSWWDVLGFTVWHALVISLGFFRPAWWAPVMVVAVLAGIALFWLALWQLWSEARPSRVILRMRNSAYLAPAERPTRDVDDVLVVREHQVRQRS